VDESIVKRQELIKTVSLSKLSGRFSLSNFKIIICKPIHDTLNCTKYRPNTRATIWRKHGEFEMAFKHTNENARTSIHIHNGITLSAIYTVKYTVMTIHANSACYSFSAWEILPSTADEGKPIFVTENMYRVTYKMPSEDSMMVYKQRMT